MNIVALVWLSILSPLGATVEDFFGDYTIGAQEPRDVVAGCYGGQLGLGSRQFFFDTENFLWTVEISVGVPDFSFVNFFMKRQDPTGQHADVELTCMNQSIVVERNEDSGFLSSIVIRPSGCLERMARVVMLDRESKLANARIDWIQTRYIFAFNAMALTHKPYCEYLDVVYEAEQTLGVIRTSRGESLEAADIFAAVEVGSEDIDPSIASLIQTLMNKYRVTDE